MARTFRSLASGAKRRVKQLLGLPTPSVPDGQRRQWFDAHEIDELTRHYFAACSGQGASWDVLRDAHLRLPEWFIPDIDPWSEAYAKQQERLWQLIAGVDRPYEAEVDEREHSWGDIDVIRQPGFFVRRDPQAVRSAGDHTVASGMIMLHSGLQAGQWALEYGAGFGQTALNLARLDVNVDTVDISRAFCDYVRRQAEFFQVPLTAFHGPFGFAPRPEQRYDLIWFYESFHHCVDFQRVVPALRALLAPGGRIILGGEPIVEQPNAAVPYPWGIRLHSEVVAVVRQQHWFELGFSEAFLFELFARSGLVGRRVDCEPSLFGRLHIFERAPAES